MFFLQDVKINKRRKFIFSLRWCNYISASKLCIINNLSKHFVDDIRTAEKSLGYIDYTINKAVQKNRHFMRSLYVIKDIKKGEKFTSENIGSFRPNLGMLRLLQL